MKTRAPGRGPSKPSLNRRGVAAVQAIWSGTISFSLVAILVQLVKAVDSGRISFNMLHGKDYSPLHRRMFCPEEDRIVSADEVIRGYEIGPDKYILISDEELESVSPERSRTIEIMEFIDMEEVDPIYYDHPYYLVPSKGGEKAYRLLAEVFECLLRFHDRIHNNEKSPEKSNSNGVAAPEHHDVMKEACPVTVQINRTCDVSVSQK